MKTDLELAELCELAYEKVHSAPDELEYTVNYCNDHTYICVRGTEFSKFFSGLGFADVIRNLRICPFWSRHTGWLHAGYLAGAKSVYNDLQDVAEISGGLVIAGHSMGAAVAAPLAQMLHKITPVSRLVLFGCPKVYLSRPKFEFPVASYRNGSDIVTRVHPMYKQPAPLIELLPNPLPLNKFEHRISEYVRSLKVLDR